MKSIKGIVLSAFLTIGAFGAMTYTACNKDECKDVVCENGGTCSGGNCNCTSGYEGDRCQTLSITKFVKSWTANDQIGSTNLVYTVAIAAGSPHTNAIISNAFSDNFFNNNVTATVDKEFITISDQKPDANGDYRVEGQGTYETNNTITWTYTITRISDGATQNYTGTWQ